MSKYTKNILQLISILFILIAGFACNSNFKDTKLITKELNSTWRFRKLTDTDWYPAEVPGTVHTDLYHIGLIPDPFYGTNEKEIQWIENEDWEYQTLFDLDTNILNKKNIELSFKGLDTYATVRLNGKVILSTDNMFRTWTKECKDLLKQTGNQLNIVFRSPMKINLPKVDSLPYHLPAGNDRSEKKTSVFARKAPYHFGWDWGPRFVTAGIWRPIEIVAWNNTRIADFQVFQGEISDSEASLKAEVELESTGGQKITLALFNGDDLLIKKEIQLNKGANNIEQEFIIKKPKLWWTNGLGEAHLYNLSVRILNNETVIDQKATRFGIRTIEIVQQPDSVGKSFYFKLNGVPVFMKGANYIPQDNFLPQVTDEKYKELILSAKKVHMNMLRVWGGGIYENDLFYDLCDENGILVWQDFMFACSMYPGDMAFLQNVEQEATENIKRLRNHPSIALWCGNNEMQVAWERWGYQKAFAYSKADSTKIYDDYLKVFQDILPNTLNKLDSGRFYWPSSPNSAPSGWHEESLSGDMHYWDVWWGKKPFSAYEENVGRFMSEYGFQSLPIYATVKKYAAHDDRHLTSSVMKSHNKHPIGFETIKEYMKRDYNIPNSIDDYVLVSQLLQAEGMKTAIEAYRRAMPYCMGSLYWQLNDCWPVVSWASIDYFGKWKAFHYYLRKLYAPVMVSPVYKAGELKVFLVSDYLENRSVKLNMTLMDFYGTELWQHDMELIMKGNASKIVFTKPFGGIMSKLDTNKVFMHIEITGDGKLLAENNLFFAKVKDMILPKSEIKYNIIHENGKLGIKILSNVLSKNIFIDYADDKGNFSDNYFDILPGEVKTVWIDMSEEEFKKQVKTKSLINRFNIKSRRE